MIAESPNRFVPASEAQIRETCEALLCTKIEGGFHLELGMGASEYKDSFGKAIEDIVNGESCFQGAVPGLVEERIPFVRQLQLLGIGLDPGIYYEVVHHQWRQPYGVWLEVFKPCEGPFLHSSNYQEAVTRLPSNMVPATPFEGINTDIASVLAKSFVTLPAGEYKMPGILTGGSTRFDTLCLNRYLGRPRISHLRFAEIDYLVGMLAAYK